MASCVKIFDRRTGELLEVGPAWRDWGLSVKDGITFRIEKVELSGDEQMALRSISRGGGGDGLTKPVQTVQAETLLAEMPTETLRAEALKRGIIGAIEAPKMVDLG